jgi:hypothetical protein
MTEQQIEQIREEHKHYLKRVEGLVGHYVTKVKDEYYLLLLCQSMTRETFEEVNQRLQCPIKHKFTGSIQEFLEFLSDE